MQTFEVMANYLETGKSKLHVILAELSTISRTVSFQ